MRRREIIGFFAVGVLIGLAAARLVQRTNAPNGPPPVEPAEETAAVDRTPVIAPALEAATLAETEEARAYFADVALDIEYGEGGGVLRRWAEDIRLAVHGSPTDDDRRELDRIIAELNTLLRGITISIETHRVNAEIHFAPESAFTRLEPNYRPTNYGFFWTRWNGRHEINWARILIDTETMNLRERAHLMREELTQCLGLMQDSPLYEDSIFQVAWTRVTEFSAIDRALVYMLYDPRLEPGMNADTALAVLRSAR